MGTRFQALPFQRTIRVCCTFPTEYVPTAHAFLADVAVTPKSWLLAAAPPTSGLFIVFHAVPFQCSISVWLAVPLNCRPTAHALFADTTATSKTRWFDAAASAGAAGAAIAAPATRVVAPAAMTARREISRRPMSPSRPGRAADALLGPASGGLP